MLIIQVTSWRHVAAQGVSRQMVIADNSNFANDQDYYNHFCRINTGHRHMGVQGATSPQAYAMVQQAGAMQKTRNR